MYPYRRKLSRLRSMSWRYSSWSTTATVGGVSVLTGLAAHAMVPPGPGPRGAASVLVASTGSYVVMRLGFASGLSKRVKHEWLDLFEGDVDDAQTWLLGTLGGAMTLVALRETARRIQGPAPG